MEQRFVGFFTALRDGAKQSGAELDIELYDTKELDVPRLVAKFPRGMAVENVEGPAATPFKASVGALLIYVSLTDRVFTFYNEIAARVTKVYPDMLFGVHAYAEGRLVCGSGNSCKDRVIVTELAEGSTADWPGAFGDPQTNTFALPREPQARLVPMREIGRK